MASASPNPETVVPHAGRGARVVATFFGIGYLKPGSGTWAAAVTALLWFTIAYFFVPAQLRWPIALAASIVITLIGIPASTSVARADRNPDPGHVVIDEVAGQLIALIAAPLSWKSFLAGFILFRVFDIVKPPPVRQLEQLPEGTGIMVDDVGAGILALIVLQLLLHFGLLS